MPDNKTVFVVGAGASCEVNLPIGTKLKKNISTALDFEFDYRSIKKGHLVIWHAIERYLDTLEPERRNQRELDSFFYSCHQICDSLPLSRSIDSYIHSQRDDERIRVAGKLAIVNSISESERTSYIKLSDRPTRPGTKVLNIREIEKTWYVIFYQILSDGCTLEEIGKRLESIYFIVFNYDRCLEHFLYYAILSQHPHDESKVRKILRKSLNVYHPYGSIGLLPWQTDYHVDHIQYGAKLGPDALLETAKKIQTYTESTNNSDNLDLAKDKLGEANTIIFLGFSFLELNMQLLRIDNPLIQRQKRLNVKCLFTTHGMTESDIYTAASLISKYLKVDAINQKEKLSCYEFFIEYGSSLASKL